MGRCVVALLMSLMLTGCVTNEYGANANREADPQKELADNIRLAKAYIQEGYTVRAIEPLNRALELDSSSAEAYSVLAIVYQIEGDADQADYNYKKAISLNSSASDIQHNYGAFLYRQDRSEEAVSHLLKAAENIRYTRRSISFQVLGLCERKLGNIEMAEIYFLRALRLERALPVASIELAEIYYGQEKYNQSLANYDRFTEYADQTSRSLLLGIRLAKVFSDSDREASYALQLNRFYPGSPELKEYQEMQP